MDEVLAKRAQKNRAKRLEKIEMIREEFSNHPSFEVAKRYYLASKIKTITSIKKYLKETDYYPGYRKSQ